MDCSARRTSLSLPGRSTAALCALALGACSPLTLTDRTAVVSPIALPDNLQVFAADVTIQPSYAIGNVALDLNGTLTPLRAGSGSRWSVQLPVPLCESVQGYRFNVDYTVRRTGESPTSETFPPVGHFIRRYSGRSADCGRTGAATFIVNTSSDLVDANPGDGLCATTADPKDPLAQCTLRAAVMEANATPGLNLIELSRGISYVLTLAGTDTDAAPNAAVGDLDVTDSVVIESAAFRLNGCDTNLDRVLVPTVDGTGHAYLNGATSGVTVARIDGNGIDRVFDLYGGSGKQGLNEVYLNCVHVTGGARRDELRAQGGGVRNSAVLSLYRTVVSQNSLPGDNNRGAGIFNSGQLALQESAVLNNLGKTSGAIFGGTTGGGIYNRNGGLVVIDRSLIALNSAARAPAIHNEQGGTVLINNSTVALQDRGGDEFAGAQASALSNNGTMQIYWSTIYERNRSSSGALGLGDAPLLLNDGSVQLSNSLLVTSNSPSGVPGCSGTGTISSVGGNVAGLATCLGPRLLALDRIREPAMFIGDFVSPRLGGFLLGDNGGFLPTIGTNSFAVRPPPFVDPPTAFVGALPFCPAVDQRGFPRPADGDGDGTARCDTGAFELNAK